MTRPRPPEVNKIVFHKTTPELQDQDYSVQDQDHSLKDQDRFFGLGLVLP